MVFPHSIGLLYSAFTAFLGFEVNEGEYKVMGMAPYGQPRYMDKVWKLIRQESDGSFSLDMDYFCFQHSTDRTFNNRFVELFGDPRPPKMLFFTKESGFPTYFGEPPSNFAELCKLNQHYADIASSIQQVTEEVLLGMARGRTQRDRPEAAVHCRWRGPEQRRQSAHPARDSVRRALHPALGGRRRRSAGSCAVGGQHAAGKSPAISHEPRLLGQGLQARRKSATFSIPTRSPTSTSRTMTGSSIW